MFRRRFWWSLLLTVPVVVTSPMVMDWFGYHLDFTAIDWIGPILGSVIFFWCGGVFLSGAWVEIQERQPGMMLLVAMAISVAYAASARHHPRMVRPGVLVGAVRPRHDHVARPLAGDEGPRSSAIGPCGLGRTLARRSRTHRHRRRRHHRRHRRSRTRRHRARPPRWASPRRWHDRRGSGGDRRVDDHRGVASGGEGRRRPRRSGDRRNRLLAPGSRRSSRRRHTRSPAFNGSSPRRSPRRVVPRRSPTDSPHCSSTFAAGAGLLTFIVWALAGDVDEAVVRTVTVLVIACPHALGLAIPLVISLSSTLAAQAGILIKNRLALERMRTIDAVLFDKTGTLTKGEHIVTGITGVNLSDDEVLQLAAAVEAESEHPLARAIVAAAAQTRPLVDAVDFRSITGRGVEAIVDGNRYAVGGPALLRERATSEPLEVASATDGWRSRGTAILYLIRDDEVVGALALEDEIRPEAREAIEQLRKLGRRVIMITGDAHQVAEAVGQRPRIGRSDVRGPPPRQGCQGCHAPSARPVRRHGR